MPLEFLLYVILAIVIFNVMAVIWFALRPVKSVKAVVAEIDRLIREEATRNRVEDETRARALREELSAGLKLSRDSLEVSMRGGVESQAKTLEDLRGAMIQTIKGFGDSLKKDVDTLSYSLKERFGVFGDSLNERQSGFEKAVSDRLTISADRISALAKSNAEAHAELKSAVEQRLEKMRADNEAKLEQMRLTVDEKLQSTLEKRIGESFKHVSERLENVHRGLGEMQSLAIGVGDLKKVLSNVKDRGGWAEGQLGEILSQQLASDQFVKNAKVDPNSNELVEFAVKFPGSLEGREVLLPIDAKFPKEDYERLAEAWSSGDQDAAREAIASLERVIESEAKKISSKYIRPPYTTDVAIMFLPTEGLYAEVIRIPGLSARLQSVHRVSVAGPNTLWAILTSLKMGFRTLAMQKQTSEVWQILGVARSEFEKYAGVWDRLGKQLQTAQKTVDAVGVRTRAITRTLRDIESDDKALGDLSMPMLELVADDDAESENEENVD